MVREPADDDIIRALTRYGVDAKDLIRVTAVCVGDIVTVSLTEAGEWQAMPYGGPELITGDLETVAATVASFIEAIEADIIAKLDAEER